MEWESDASGKPIPTNGGGPDVKTIRRLMDRLVTAGKARIIKVETPGFLGDNRPVRGAAWVTERGLEVAQVKFLGTLGRCVRGGGAAFDGVARTVLEVGEPCFVACPVRSGDCRTAAWGCFPRAVPCRGALTVSPEA